MVRRGCGERVQNGLYACVDSSPNGLPIEYFLIDPPIVWRGACPLRSPMLVQDRTGIYHVVLGIGKKWYPFVSDYVEEARVMGISKRFPRNFDPSPLTPGKSKLILMHPRGVPQFSFKLRRCICPKGNGKPHDCIGALWDLSSEKHFREVHEIEDMSGDQVRITTPSVTYVVNRTVEAPEWEDQVYLPALILQFGKWHFEFVNKDGFVPKDLKKKIEEANFKLEVVPE